MRSIGWIVWLTVVVASTALAGGEDQYTAERQRMLREIVAMAADTAAETGRAQLDERVIAALARVPRHRFVPAGLTHEAYANRPLPIGYGQTISQPYIVALMTDLLRLKPGERALEIGTGSGYQAAVLAELGVRTYSIEIIEPLARQAAANLKAAGYPQVQLRVGDGYYGWPEAAPFDAIIVTAAASHVPPPLVRQLKAGGRMVIPVGAAFMTQQLLLVEKHPDGRLSTRQILPVRFVPLTGGPSR
ncbi:MAG: protein-L-isoaspartate(D-aspartate) O-methyltransferase [Thiobacillaceae bacterium]|nr:protein-L-isoaspartate(D-aspartate) O-methyltransferase [Thiobacillaceae bacterium]MCX7672288.1 protein-L-isoaspartate(D-aspartate) O-methyltransferase [Thiobacillaceae bacterium]MDW8322683.1 protein-L-isoaspartate(D-aspartate) O-methyltransferase [Burkholderiales bacterium]